MERGFRISFRFKLMATIFVVLLVLSVALSFSVQQISVKNFTEMEQRLLTSNLGSMRTRLNNALDSARNATNTIVSLPQLPQLADLGDDQKVARMILRGQVLPTLEAVLSTNSQSNDSSIAYLGVYLENGYNIEVGNQLFRPDFANYQQCCRELGQTGVGQQYSYTPTLWFDSAPSGASGWNNCLVGVRFLYRPITLEKYGVVVMAVTQESLRNVFVTVNEPVCIMRQDGTVLCRSQRYTDTLSASQLEQLTVLMRSRSGAFATTLADGSFAWLGTITGSGTWLVCVTDSDRPSALTEGFARQSLLITMLVLSVGLIAAWLSSRGLTSSLRRLTGTVQQVYSGDLSARFQPTGDDEINYLGLKINDMLVQVEDSLRTQQEDAATKRNLELQLLHAQINPHLLYNTLNSVAWCIRQNDPETANALIFSLSSFFRLTLSKGKEEITLDDELALIRHYLQIQNLGRGKSYCLRDEVPQTWRTCKVLRLTLQPLVENAVIHGFSDWRDDGVITVTATPDETGTRLSMTVRDNGIGILPEDLRSLNDLLQTYPPKNNSTHYGLYNIHQRLRNKYGKGFGLTLDSQVGEYTTMTLTYPISKEDSHA